MLKIKTTLQHYYMLTVFIMFSAISYADEMDELEEKGTEAVQSLINLVLAWSIGLMTLCLIGCGLAYAFTSQSQKAKAWAGNIGIGMGVVAAAGLIAKAGFAAFGS